MSSSSSYVIAGSIMVAMATVVAMYYCDWMMRIRSSNRRQPNHHSTNDDDGNNDHKPFLTYQPYEPKATLWSDWQVLRAMWFANITGTDLQERLDSFYERQADLYDSYRFRMLHGRPKMLQGVARHVVAVDVAVPPSLPSLSLKAHYKEKKDDDGPPAAASSSLPSEKKKQQQTRSAKERIVWVDLACGTGANVENFASDIIMADKFEAIYLVDLCRPLCRVAQRERADKYNNRRDGKKQCMIHVLHGDVTDPHLPGLPAPGSVDVVTISYSLVMIPDWRQCLRNAQRLLRPGSGIIGVCDFTVVPSQQSKLSQAFWKRIFATDHVFLNAAHLTMLQEQFETLEVAHGYGPLPYTPFFLQPAYFHFVGRKRKSKE